jgi:uncharacterized Zn-binding protein involved in type VI secretion
MRKTLAALIGAAATVMMITGAGAASAATGSPASPHAAVTGTEHFQLVSSSVTSNGGPVAAYGVFNASGAQVPISNSKDTFKFPSGSFVVKHTATRTRQHFSKRTCAGTVHQRGIYKISKGTGAYAGISGHGRYRLRVLLVARHTATDAPTSRSPSRPSSGHAAR